jgi:murein DD-endopeptidase MepM/ murein hydrolase activator NlpD
MKLQSYTLFVASSRRGIVRKITVPLYALHLLILLTAVGGITVAAGVRSYARMLWKVSNYNALERKENRLQNDYQQLQDTVKDTNQRVSSLESLATKVAVTYGFARLRNTPFRFSDSSGASEVSLDNTLAEFTFLQKNAASAAVANNGLRLISNRRLVEIALTPTLWPVIGPITGQFGERLDPFSGEGAFHTGVDISAEYGEGVRASADGVVIEAAEHAGYGQVVIIDHGLGVTSWYGHLASFAVPAGMSVTRGDIIGHVGVSGRTTGPHLHYEIRINDAPVDPVRYLRAAAVAD